MSTPDPAMVKHVAEAMRKAENPRTVAFNKLDEESQAYFLKQAEEAISAYQGYVRGMSAS